MEPSSELRVVLAQTEISWHDGAANRKALEGYLPPAGTADLVVLPEMFATGFTMDSAGQAEPADGPSRRWLLEHARARNYSIAGSLAIRENGGFFNRFFLATKEGQLHSYDKRHLFRMAGEHLHYDAGTERGLMFLDGWRIQPQICYDLRFPGFFRNAPLPGASPEHPALLYDLVICVANWPAPRAEHWRALLIARAIENQCFVVAVNRIGTDGNGVSYQGDSLVVSPTGELLVDAGREDGVFSARLDPDMLRDWRSQFPAWMDGDLAH